MGDKEDVGMREIKNIYYIKSDEIRAFENICSMGDRIVYKTHKRGLKIDNGYLCIIFNTSVYVKNENSLYIKMDNLLKIKENLVKGFDIDGLVDYGYFIYIGGAAVKLDANMIELAEDSYMDKMSYSESIIKRMLE